MTFGDTQEFGPQNHKKKEIGKNKQVKQVLAEIAIHH